MARKLPPKRAAKAKETKVKESRLGKEQVLVLLGILVLAVIIANVYRGGPQYKVEDLKIGAATAEPTPDEIAARVAVHVKASGTPVVGKIIDVDALKAKAPVVYEGAENGQYVLQYPDWLVIYDFEGDKIVKQLPLTSVDLSQPQGQQGGLPTDFMAKVAKQTGRTEEPVVAQILDVDALKAQQPAVYEGTANGQFVLQYSDMLVIYDYGAGRVVKSFPIQSVNINQ